MATQKRTTRSSAQTRGQPQSQKRQQSPAAPKERTDVLSGTAHRSTLTHVFFYGGVLSNWNQSSTFSGARCFELLLPQLDELNVSVSRPVPDAIVSRLMAEHMFNCGEQWMMAVKAWLFERNVSQDAVVDEQTYQRLKAGVYKTQPPKGWETGSKERDLWEGTVCGVLRAKKPAVQKALGRRARGFDAGVWDAVNVACVVAACVARAERDLRLRAIYLAAGKRAFVEGSPSDRIWGVGVHWTDPAIEDPSSWVGENRLGRCHDQAARMIRDMYGDNLS